jgi:hypothetical protein
MSSKGRGYHHFSFIAGLAEENGYVHEVVSERRRSSGVGLLPIRRARASSAVVPIILEALNRMRHLNFELRNNADILRHAGKVPTIEEIGVLHSNVSWGKHLHLRCSYKE